MSKKRNNPGNSYVVGNQHKDITEHRISKAPQTGRRKKAPTHEQNSQVSDCKAEEKIVGGGVHTLVPADISISNIIIIFHLMSAYIILFMSL